jgi:predicted RNase H-like HicB family nuclease
MSRRRKSLAVIVEPPTQKGGVWLISAPAINYTAQGGTKAEALRLFEQTLDEAIDWAVENGIDLDRVRQPEYLEYEL